MVDISLIAMATGFVLILIGLYGALTNGNLLRMIVAFTVADAGVNLVLVSVGYMRGRTAPILDSAVPTAEAVARIIRPGPPGPGADRHRHRPGNDGAHARLCLPAL